MLSIENLVLQTLQKGSLSTQKLIGEISRLRPKTTKQGIYQVLRKLKSEEKTVVHGKSVSLNIQWLKRMGEFFSLAQFYYEKRIASPDSFLSISGKDKIVYFFKNLNLLDSFASHVLHLLDAVVNKKEPIFAYNPHEWFAYARQEAEEMLIDTFQKSQRLILITSMHNDPLDRELKKRFSGGLAQYNIASKPIVKSDNYYCVFLGDYLVELFIDKKIHNEINAFYERTIGFNEEAKKELIDLIWKTGKHKLVISKNKRKIDSYRRALSKDFYIKKITVS